MKYEFKSIWDDTLKKYPKFKELKNNMHTDVCIIGGGITGVSTGYNLYKNNVEFILLEKNKICNNTSKLSTAKITSQHNIIYSKIKKKYGLKKAQLYLEANNLAIRNIEDIILKENIDCELRKQDSYVFTQDKKYIKYINDEYKTLIELNFKDAELFNNLNIHLKTEYAIRFKNQASFNPLKYTISLANIIKDNIYENCNVTRIKRENKKFIVYTSTNTISCNKLIITTHFPIKDIPGFYFLKMYQDTSYVIAADIGKNPFDGMYISVEDPTISLRSTTVNNKNILLIGGNDTKTGDVINENKYIFLEKIAKQMYPDCKIIKRWNTQDCITLDNIPYIGYYSSIYPNLYLATGFNKWGITTSNIAANIITDKILGKTNKYESLFKATRLHPIKNIKELYFNLNQTIQSLIINKYKVKKEEMDKIPNNTGKIIKHNNVNIGIYKDKNGKVYKINPYCSHLKCLLTFNNQDKTWDCPCHGSRFDIYGNILYGPANEDI